jgi:hypothetical protein
MKVRDKAAIRLLIESVPLILAVGLLTNVPTFGGPVVIAGFVLLVMAVIIGRRVWPLDSAGTIEPPRVSNETQQNRKSDTMALFITVGITMMIAIWIALRIAK